CLPGGYDGPIVKRRGFWSRRDRRPAAVVRSMQLGIRPGGLTMLRLNPYRREMPFPGSSLFLGEGTRLHASRTAVVADAIDSHIVVDDSFVINVAHVHDIDVVHSTVVVEAVAFPPSANIAVTRIAEAIHDPAIE